MSISDVTIINEKGVLYVLKLGLLKPFTFYRSQTPVLMPEDLRKPKMGSLYTVLAPSPTAALNWAHDMDNVFRFRNLYRYFVPKFFSEKLYDNGAMKHNIPEEFKLAEFIDELQTEPGQLKNVQFVSYRANASANLLRGYNVYYDLNYIIQLVLDNPKDHRPLYKKMDDVISMLTVGLHGSLHQYQLSGYKDKTIIIPVNLWTSEMKNLSIFRKTTKDEFGAFIQAIGNDEGFKNLFHDYRVVLVNINELMILDPLLIPDDSKGDFIRSNITTFLRRCKSTDTAVATEADTEEEAAELKQVENLSKKQNTTTKVLNKITPDNVSISKDTAQKVQKAVEIAAQAKKENTEPVVYMSQEVDVSPTDEPVEDETKEVSTPADIITQARLSGQSIANYQRNEMLKKRYKELTIDNRPIEEVIKSEEKYVIPKKTVPANTINPAYKELTSYNFEKAYNDQLFMHDLARILIHFSKADPPLYLLDDPKIVDISNGIDKLYHSIPFLLRKLTESLHRLPGIAVRAPMPHDRLDHIPRTAVMQTVLVSGADQRKPASPKRGSAAPLAPYVIDHEQPVLHHVTVGPYRLLRIPWELAPLEKLVGVVVVVRAGLPRRPVA